MDQFCCPSCFKDYEICHRCRDDDAEFTCTPKVLNCLHTCCNSCLEAMIQKNPHGGLICPLCKETSSTKGVRYLPFDGCAMKEAVQEDNSAMMTHCSRCHDEIESFSWCLDCSISLCEFHHNDHKRSIDTSHHRLATLDDIDSKKVKIEPHLPPVPCPDVFGQNCSMFCHTCKHPISSQSMVSYHKNHRLDDCRTYAPVCMDELTDVIDQLTDMKHTLSDAIDDVKNSMRRLDSQVNATATSVVEEIEKCRAALAERENALLRRLESVANEKRLLLTNQLNEISDVYEDCSACATFSHHVMQELPEEQGGIYVMASTPLIKDRHQSLCARLEKLVLVPVAHPVLSTDFNVVERELLNNVVNSFGAVRIHDFNDINSLYESSTGEAAVAIAAKQRAKMPPIAIYKADAKDKSKALALTAEATTTGAAAFSDDSGSTSSAKLTSDAKMSLSNGATASHIPTGVPAQVLDGDIHAQFSVHMSPPLSVENVQKKEIRDIRSSVVEIRACTSSYDGAASRARRQRENNDGSSNINNGSSRYFKSAKDTSGYNPPFPPLGFSQTVSGRTLSALEDRDGISDSDLDDDEEEDRKELSAMVETGTKIQLLRQKKEVAALSSRNESEINELCGGAVIGRVVVVNETLHSILARHEIRTLVESLTHDDGLPVLRVTTEVLRKPQ